MLANLGIQRLAYDWRAEHIPTFDAEVDAMRVRNIEISAWWFPAALNAEARAILECIERKKIHPQLWITMGTEPEPDAARLQQKLSSAVATLAPLCAEARRLVLAPSPGGPLQGPDPTVKRGRGLGHRGYLVLGRVESQLLHRRAPPTGAGLQRALGPVRI